jgi:EAL domain-containing protein (putative c-di-GMP-specific phosphodiesterase class I)
MTALLARNELVVMLADLRAPEDAKNVALRIAEKLAGGHRIGDADIFLSASVGIATYPTNASTPEELLDRAEAALRYSQQTGGERCNVYTPEIAQAARERLDMESCLRMSLARSNIAPRTDTSLPVTSEFQLVYQPKVEVPSGKVVGAEALLRWISPERGFVSPATFIPIAEETGLIVPLGQWVLETACKQAKSWSLDSSTRLRVAVNVSVRQFREPSFVAVVAKVLADTGVDPSLIELEITEGMIMENTKRSMQRLNELKALGVRIALDDFGTGYSSLSYLLRLPADSLKIDRSFINALSDVGRGGTIIAAIIGLSRGLGFDIVVEGVETAEQLAFVESQGVVEIQGYFFAKPMPPAALDGWRAQFETRDFHEGGAACLPGAPPPPALRAA